jgi:hypothetical protein
MWGKRNNHQRFKCLQCGKLFLWKNPGASKNQKLKLFRKWIMNRSTINEIVKLSGWSLSTLRKNFKSFIDHPPSSKIYYHSECHLIIDGSYFKNNFCLLNYYDTEIKRLQYFRTAEHENYLDYLIDLDYLKQVGLNVVSITSDGQLGLIKAVKQIFPKAVHQRCIIHVQRMSLIYLTQRPKTEAGKNLRILVRNLHLIKTTNEKELWIKLFEDWCQKHEEFLKEKSWSISGKSWYTHKLLRRTRSLIKNSLPNLFHYLENSKIHKSTNALETQFSFLKNNLRIHRGLNEQHRKNFVLWYLFFKNND